MIADNTGSFFYYEATGELRNPFKLFKNNLPSAVDSVDEGGAAGGQPGGAS